MSEVTLSVSQVTEFVAAVVQRELPEPIWIEGEIANISRSAKGHVYFKLIEPGERGATGGHSLSVTLLNWYREKVNLNLKRAGGNVRMGDGVRVRIRGQLELYPARSQLQLKMMAIDPVFTLGTLAAERAKLLEALKAEGLLDYNTGVPLSPIPQRVGLVTSLGSAAHADFISEIAKSPFHIEVLEFDSRVQGIDAAESILVALQRCVAAEVELIAIVRGGGAKTDLAVFDHPEVARAVAALNTAVWTGLGHETDDSVTDVVAHTRHKTPSTCAAAINERIRLGAERLENMWSLVLQLSTQISDTQSTRINQLGAAATRLPSEWIQKYIDVINRAETQIPSHAGRCVERCEAQLDNLTKALVRRPTQLLSTELAQLNSVESTIKAYDPKVAIARGWSITRTADGKIPTAESLEPGDQLITQLVDGVVSSTVSDSHKELK